jgi:hypothetical protein
MNKKIYSERFATDCFSDFFAYRSLNCESGFCDLSAYRAVKPTFDELKKQNSYFIRDLEDNLLNEEAEEKKG